MSAAWIELEDVHLKRGNRPVLQGINASLAGRAIGLVGANGAGKSTLIGALLGVLRAEAGRIRVLGLELPKDAMEVRARAGVMAEQAGVFPGGSGVDAVLFAGMLSGLSRREALRRAHRALDALDVGEERYRPTSGFSTGMRQRCKLAMSLVHDPGVLILDEPTVGLDPPGRTQLLELIRDLRDEGRRILMSTHILQDAEMVCDDMLLLEGGTVAYSGTVSSLLGDARDTLVATGRSLDRVAEKLAPLGIPVTEAGPERLVFQIASDEQLLAFWKVVAGEEAEVRSLGRDHPTLEDAVVAVMEGNRGK